jgi:hypothetical protein
MLSRQGSTPRRVRLVGLMRGAAPLAFSLPAPDSVAADRCGQQRTRYAKGQDNLLWVQWAVWC